MYVYCCAKNIALPLRPKQTEIDFWGTVVKPRFVVKVLSHGNFYFFDPKTKNFLMVPMCFFVD
jgi:hypothetical protein